LAARDIAGELLRMEEPRKRIAGMMSGLDIRYDRGRGIRCWGVACPIST
jgi:3-(3-hydroxy-phenyl)propionate hydroxylase